MRKLFALLLIMILPMLVIAQNKSAAQNRPLVFRNVTLIDMRSEQPQPNMTVLISDNRIAKIGENIKIPKNAEVIEASGKFLIPGLWDNYTYTLEAVKNNFPYFELLIAHGVTGVRDVGTSMDLAEAARLRSDINAGRILAPRLFYAGTVLIGEMPPRRSNRWTGISTIVKTTEEAEKAVETLSRAGVDHIKTEKRLPPEILKAVIAAAHKLNLRVVAVPPSFIIDASNDGLDCVEHAAEIFRATSNKRNEYYALYRDRKIDSMTIDENYAFFGTMKTDVPYYEETLKTLARNRTFVVTNKAQTNTFNGDFELIDPLRRRFKTKKQLEELQAVIKERTRQIRNQDYRMSDSNRQRQLREMLDLHKAGVMLLAGTQVNHSSDVISPGFSLHDELAIFVQSGLSPFEALKTATVNPAKFMRREKDLGIIEKGKLADLVLLDANPLVDISNTRKINAVVTGGRYLSRKLLDKMLSDVEVWAKGQ
ncbi:MAG: amidohydrolase family protein [Acidobacteriota bacterium]|nr:amidohydrolase family protein [Acidobacteriota bacterium]